jgi:hypothetical protein
MAAILAGWFIKIFVVVAFCGSLKVKVAPREEAET